MPSIRLSAAAGLPSRRYVNPPVSVTADSWTEHELSKELVDVLVAYSAGRIVVHQDDAKHLAAFGYRIVDNVVEEIPAEEKPVEEKPAKGAKAK